MTRREAEILLMRAEGRLCVRFYRRADGTILTNNCPVGLRAIKRRVSKVASATLSAVVSFIAGLGIMSGFDLYQNLRPQRTMGALVALPPTNSENAPMLGSAVNTDSNIMVGELGVPVRPVRRGAKSHRE
jgi:hypothetical protein